jgi:hypothetical protein
MKRQMNTTFCFKQGKSPIETYEVLQTVCGDEALSFSNISEWFKRFKDEREDLQDDPRSRRFQPLEMQIQSQMSVKW